MGSENESIRQYKHSSKPVFYRLSQLVGFLLGAKFSVTVILTFALYVSTFFLFNQEESFRTFVFDFKVHGIIFCSVLSILAGGIINQFYDQEKDKITKPFRTKIQGFFKQKYFLYAYLILNSISLSISWLISPRVFIFFLVYQFVMWFYSHKLSKILIINNLTFVALSLYPFFGMLVYYRTFSSTLFFMAIFLFMILLTIDVIKDTLTKNADNIFGYTTIANYFGNNITKNIIIIFFIVLILVSINLFYLKDKGCFMSYYFIVSVFIFIFLLYLIFLNTKMTRFYSVNILRMWIFIGIISMLLDGIFSKI